MCNFRLFWEIPEQFVPREFVPRQFVPETVYPQWKFVPKIVCPQGWTFGDKMSLGTKFCRDKLVSKQTVMGTYFLRQTVMGLGTTVKVLGTNWVGDKYFGGKVSRGPIFGMWKHGTWASFSWKALCDSPLML